MAIPVNIEDLLRKEKIESNRIEFKKGWNPDSIYRTICAFANDFDNIGGGYVLVGVEEDEYGRAKRPVEGIAEESVDGILKQMVGYNNKIEPFYMPRTEVARIDGKCILVIWVPAGAYRPYAVRDRVSVSGDRQANWYVRSGSSSVEAKGETLDNLRDMASRVPFDERGNPEIGIEDLSMGLVLDYLEKVKSRIAEKFYSLPFEEILEMMDLFTGPTENRLLKNVAAMMFSKKPSKFFPVTRVDIVIFPEGCIKNPNWMIEPPAIEGSVPQMIEQALNYLRTHVLRQMTLKSVDKAESIRFYNYPYKAIEEALVNALYHRDYQEREPVEITIEPDKISILSYAGPDRSISMEAIEKAERLKSRRYRNRRLGDYLKELQLSEGRATGIPTIQDALRNNGSPPARIETDVDRSYFLIEIPCHEGFEDSGDLWSDIVSEPAGTYINETDRLVLKAVADSPGIKRGGIMSATGLSLASVIKVLNAFGIEPLKLVECRYAAGRTEYFLTKKGEELISSL